MALIISFVVVVCVWRNEFSFTPNISVARSIEYVNERINAMWKLCKKKNILWNIFIIIYFDPLDKYPLEVRSYVYRLSFEIIFCINLRFINRVPPPFLHMFRPLFWGLKSLRPQVRLVDMMILCSRVSFFKYKTDP